MRTIRIILLIILFLVILYSIKDYLLSKFGSKFYSLKNNIRDKIINQLKKTIKAHNITKEELFKDE